MEPKFVELTRWGSEPISIKIDEIIAFYPNPYFKENRKVPTTIVALGSNTYEVEEDYKTVSKKINGMGQKELTIEYNEQDEELIEKWIETLRNTGYIGADPDLILGPPGIGGYPFENSGWSFKKMK